MFRVLTPLLFICLMGIVMPLQAQQSSALTWPTQIYLGEENCGEIAAVRASATGKWRALSDRDSARPSHAWLRVPTPELGKSRTISIPRESAHFFHVILPGQNSAQIQNLYLPNPPYASSGRWVTYELIGTGLAADALICLVAPRVAPSMLQVLPTAEHQAREQSAQALQAGSLSVMFSVALSALVFWWWLRDRLYLLYCAHVLCFAVWCLGGSYVLARVMRDWPSAPTPSFITTQLSFALSVCLIILFALRFTDLTRWAPRMAKLLSVCAKLSLLLAPLQVVAVTLFGSYQALIILPGNVLVVFAGFVLLATEVRVAWRGNRYARFFLLGWTPIIALGVVQALLRLHNDVHAFALHDWFLPAAAFEALMISLGLADRSLSLRRERDVARKLAEMDALTGILNRRGILDRLDASAQKESGALLLCDLDHFKQINDRYGHDVGDDCLRSFATIAASIVQEPSALGRYGGEEFAVVLPNKSVADARQLAEDLRQRLAYQVLRAGHIEVKVSVSIGISAYVQNESTRAAISRADKALYHAKAAGRDRVEVAQ
jgi:diguanylate cyclase (GGDEF)-like protein